MATKKTETKTAAVAKTQTELVREVAEKNGIQIVKAKEVLESFGELAARELKSAGSCIVPGIGKLKATATAARTGRNPSTGEAIQIAAGTRISLAAGKAFKDAVG